MSNASNETFVSLLTMDEKGNSIDCQTLEYPFTVGDLETFISMNYDEDATHAFHGSIDGGVEVTEPVASEEAFEARARAFLRQIKDARRASKRR